MALFWLLDVSVQHYVDARASPITWTMSPGREHEQADMNFGDDQFEDNLVDYVFFENHTENDEIGDHY